MSDNVHGHQKPERFNINPDNPIFQRDQPDPVVAEIPQGFHGAPALRSELAEYSAEAEKNAALAAVPQPPQDAAVEAADLTARNAAIAADDAAKVAEDAQTNADLVRDGAVDPPVPEDSTGQPSAADLDAVAAEQATADETGPTNS